MNKKNPNQIMRIDGRNVFFEVMSNAFPIGKVQINFIEYAIDEEKGNRQKHNIPIYINIERFIVLAQDIIGGRMVLLAEKAKAEQLKGSYKYCKEIWRDQGGISAKKLAERGKARPDGKSLARQFKITPGDKLPWILYGEHGVGEEDCHGIIIPKYGNTPEEVVRVPLTNEDLKKFAILTMMHIQAYINSQYVGVLEG